MNLLKFTITTFLAWTSIYGVAQKLPDIQEAAKWASVPVKADGKLDNGTEMQAYNKSTRLSYTLSNDDKNLYLVVQSPDANKILMGGISFFVNTSGKKKEKDAASITFPVVTRQARGQGQRGQGGFGQRMGQGGGQATDSALFERRKQQLAQSKEIKVFGVEGVTDTLISIYNEYGIKAGMNVDIKGECIYELVVPLAALHINSDKPKEFSYSIKVNGRQLGGNVMGRITGSGNRDGGFGGGGFGGRGNFDPSMFEPTFFWAKYSTAKP